jgi:capsular exopolysaccharide synthesis family protein
VLGVPLLADVPGFELEGLDSAVPIRDYPRSAAAEAFRFAAASTEVSARARAARLLFVVSSTIGHGKTTAAVNMAIASATHGRSVLVVDSDFGNQQASRLLVGGDHARLVGITDVISGASTLDDAIHHVDLGEGVGVSVLPRGTRPSLASSALQSKAAQEIFTELKDRFDLTYIDGPPLLQVAYASTLAEHAEGLIVVVEHESRQNEAADLADRLELLGTPVLGYIYNRSPLRREMTMTEGSMMDILGDAGLNPEIPLASKRRG